MQRLHINISVDNLDQSITFYSNLLGSAPSFQKPDYAKWLLDDPRVNLSISPTGQKTPGINHLGIQADTLAELSDMQHRLQAANQPMVDEPGAQCCYAESDKHWVTDPSGVVWELFNTTQQTDSYGSNGQPASELMQPNTEKQSACCTTH